MISKELSIRLKKAADKYEKPEFIKNDPIQFPHRFSSKCDIQISGLLTAIMSFGNRKQIIAKAEILHGMMCGEPREYILTRAYESHFPAGKTESFYRMLSYGAFRNIFDMLSNVLRRIVQTLEKLHANSRRQAHGANVPASEKLSSKSPQKKINMFLRWMVRKDSPVDFGIWQRFSPAELIISPRHPRGTNGTQNRNYRFGNILACRSKKDYGDIERSIPGRSCARRFRAFRKPEWRMIRLIPTINRNLNIRPARNGYIKALFYQNRNCKNNYLNKADIALLIAILISSASVLPCPSAVQEHTVS